MSCEMAWAAGVFEGEGSFHLTKTGPQVQIRMTDLDVIERFAAVMGFGRRADQPMAGHYKDQYGWRVTGWIGFAIAVEQLRPYLCSRRLAKIEEIEAAMPRPMPIPHGMKTHCKQGHPYDADNTRYVRNAKGGKSRQCIRCNRNIARERRRKERTAARAR